jgi:hypothetical protein
MFFKGNVVHYIFVGVEVFTEVTTTNTTFWIVTPCSWVKAHWSLQERASSILRIGQAKQETNNKQAESRAPFLPPDYIADFLSGLLFISKLEAICSRKLWRTFTDLLGVNNHKIVLFIVSSLSVLLLLLLPFVLGPLDCIPSELIWNYGTYRQLVGFLGRVISSVARPLPTRDNKNTEETRAHIYALSGIRTHDPSV